MAIYNDSKDFDADEAIGRPDSDWVPDAEALAAAVNKGSFVDDDDDRSDASNAGTVDLRKLLHAEVAPTKTIVVIWILFAAELGFDLVTTAIAFAATSNQSDECCGHTVFMGPLPMTTLIPFFFLIVAEITFLVRAILLTLWPSVYETARLAAHGEDDECGGGCEDDQIGFEVNIKKADSEGTADNSDEETTASRGNIEGEAEDATTEDLQRDGEKGADTPVAEPKAETDAEKGIDDASTSDDDPVPDVAIRDGDPEFVETTNGAAGSESGFWKRLCCCFLRWNARMILAVLNLLTLANPFFGCLIAYILLYKSDKNESFVVLGIESLSIVLHFVSVRMEGGLRTWYSKLLHSVALLPFLVTVVMVLVFLREGGMCYTVETKLFGFSGCEVDASPAEGMCRNSTGGLGTIAGGFGTDSFSIQGMINRGDDQGECCSETVNYCFFEF